jgi:hypothetical protein
MLITSFSDSKQVYYSLLTLPSIMRWRNPQRSCQSLVPASSETGVSKTDDDDDDNLSDSSVVTVIPACSLPKRPEKNPHSKYTPNQTKKRRQGRLQITVEVVDLDLARQNNRERQLKTAAKAGQRRQSRSAGSSRPSTISPLGSPAGLPPSRPVSPSSALAQDPADREAARFEQDYISFPSFIIPPKSPAKSQLPEHRAEKASFWKSVFGQKAKTPKPNDPPDATRDIPPPLLKQSNTVPTPLPPRLTTPTTVSPLSADENRIDWNDIRSSHKTPACSALASSLLQRDIQQSQEVTPALGTRIRSVVGGMVGIFSSKGCSFEKKELANIRERAYKDGFVRTFRCGKGHLHLLEAYHSDDDEGSGDCPWGQNEES